jgi:dihydropteroate synthase
MQERLRDWGHRTLIMGILNVTPDSFSDGGEYVTVTQAVERARRLVIEGADVIDIGGESTRPGAVRVSADEELRRVIPVLEALREESLGVPVSIDTYKADVAQRALAAGATIINDVWGGKADPAMLHVAANAQVPIILMHNRQAMNYGPDVVLDVIEDLRNCVRRAVDAGIQSSQIWLDPGIGFAKTREHNLQIMQRLGEITRLGYPVLLGTSRKRIIRDTLQAAADDVVEGTIATTVLGIQQGIAMVRVHDVRANVKAAAMADAIVRTQWQ